MLEAAVRVVIGTTSHATSGDGHDKPIVAKKPQMNAARCRRFASHRCRRWRFPAMKIDNVPRWPPHAKGRQRVLSARISNISIAAILLDEMLKNKLPCGADDDDISMMLLSSQCLHARSRRNYRGK